LGLKVFYSNKFANLSKKLKIKENCALVRTKKVA
jgi:hypothetical protein